jgi:asparagine synthase (glutamine-hydrolysing)
MCGICGIVSRGSPPDPEVVRAMVARLRHRGPDGEGVYDSSGFRVQGYGLGTTRDAEPGTRNPEPGVHAVLGHARLSIIDLPGGKQPMGNEDGSVQVVFNGEIYNFRELRHGLEARGHRFATRSDTEVLVHLYEEKGEELVHDLHGMFAFAIWDARRGRLVAARDRLGKKPLYYLEGGLQLAFASELKALAAIPGFDRAVDPEAIHLYLTYQYVPPPRTIFRAARKLPPAGLLTWEAERLQTRTYWRVPEDEAPDRPEGEWIERVRAALETAVRRRLVSDVPLGAFLSGGVDSSAVVAMMSRLSGAPVKTFSIGFRESAYDERPFAREVAARYGTDHEEMVVEPKALEILPRLAWHYDEPFADASMVPTWYVSEVARRRVTVALSGDGGDECFGGYDRYVAVASAARLDATLGPARRAAAQALQCVLPAVGRERGLLRRGRRFLQGLAEDAETRYLRWVGIFHPGMHAELYGADFARSVAGTPAAGLLADAFARFRGRDVTGATMLVDLETYLPHDLLVKVDIASMAHGLEVRCPFLDHELVELAARMPTRWKVRGTQGKWLLKRALADLLPASVAHRPKMGFAVPLPRWFRRELRPLLHDVVLGERARTRGYFHGAAVERLVREHEAGRADHAHRLWALLMLELWHREYADGGASGGCSAV